MVEQGEVNRLGGEREAAGNLAVVGAGRCITTGMVMGDNDPDAAVRCGIPDHIAHGQGCAGNVTVMARKVDAAGLVIDMGDPEMLLLRTGFGKAAREKSMGGLKAVKKQRGFGTLMKHDGCIGQGGSSGDVNRVQRGRMLHSKRTDPRTTCRNPQSG